MGKLTLENFLFFIFTIVLITYSNGYFHSSRKRNDRIKLYLFELIIKNMYKLSFFASFASQLSIDSFIYLNYYSFYNNTHIDAKLVHIHLLSGGTIFGQLSNYTYFNINKVIVQVGKENNRQLRYESCLSCIWYSCICR